MRESIFVGAVCFGSIVGAGFASGKEVWFYFAQFGAVCYPLIIFAGVLLFVLGFAFLQFGKRFAIASVQDLNSKIFGKLGILGEIVFIFSNLVLLSVMFAGANSLCDVVVEQNVYRFAGVLTAVISLLLSWLGFEKMVKVNIVVVPGIVCVIIFALFYCLSGGLDFTIPKITTSKTIIEAFLFAVMYVCSNLYFAGFIFARLGRFHSKKVNFLGALLASVLFVLCLLGMVTAIYLNPYSGMADMPLVFITHSAGGILGIITLVIVWLGILSTAVSLIYTIAHWLERYTHSFKISSILVCIICLICSGLGFSKIITYFYPVLSCFGIIFMMALLLKMRRKTTPKLKAKQQILE